NETSWHEECLKCNHCNLSLITEETCFFKKNKIFCKLDYYKYFGIKCAKCSRNIQSSDWVRRAKDNVYHLACFACENCKRQLSTGEEFALQNNKVLCKTHYCEAIDGDSSSKEAKNKRVRTTFTEEQLQVLQANFEVDSNPDGQDLERIAQITGLSKRVTQVWFQNSRARQKKYKEKKIDMNSGLEINDVSNEEMWAQSEMNMNRKRTQTMGANYQIVYENQGQIDNKNCLKRHKDPRMKQLTDNPISMSWTSDDSVTDDDG
ncbi:LIM homeobox Awh-like, partial [Brachionus plicatilis]